MTYKFSSYFPFCEEFEDVIFKEKQGSLYYFNSSPVLFVFQFSRMIRSAKGMKKTYRNVI